MGDRANIVVRQEYTVADPPAAPVWLYAHWDGWQVPRMLRDALAKRWRWTDPPYLTRIIFDVMTDGAYQGETGFGIGTAPPDNSHDVLVVDCVLGEVRQHAGQEGPPFLGHMKAAWTFEEYLRLPFNPDAVTPMPWEVLADGVPD